MTKLKSIDINGDIISLYQRDDTYMIVRNFHNSNRSIIMFPTKDIGFACEVWDKLSEKE